MNPLFQKISNKIQDWSTAVQTVRKWQNNGLEVVFTNGCFDLVHLGHLAYLAEAAAQGQKLVIGLNSDASVSRLKGKHRPIKDQTNRAHLLASLEMVDLVVLFEEDTPLQLIEAIQPDVLVKGGDWSIEEIVGSKCVLANGGQVKSLTFIEGYSTTKLEQKIRSRS
ncbi:D-glycero-beta-D-manno-heptose 1-phosphate adenylyltransferase [Aureispira sp. CCB-E]|uniref:D-glycero-beta-D-manno-heptose 1-phosphate adenylyltransferase n=1 Tax=Aureispira sp. CCB-E TaxID=3051121 RepID=UPI0028694DF5|nr:D-glycero-beta-D-manno-heptose 1-phosphate adenylyltransferase [Aureispira sp. CCB-E]WMX15013.1 D-glycero-beta-D-manno-heptose 1-phosphate adenylyltransferase [Aureispira sp. CCB-E]